MSWEVETYGKFAHKAIGLDFVSGVPRNNKAWANVSIY